MRAVSWCLWCMVMWSPVLGACTEERVGGAPAPPDLGGYSGQGDDVWNPADQGEIAQGDASLTGPTDTGATEPVDMEVEAEDLSDPALDAQVILEDFQRPAPEGGEPDLDVEQFYQLRGQQGCLRWEIKLQSLAFTFKSDRIFVVYRVDEACGDPLRLRVEHESDLLPVGILKDGDPWVFLPDCPGTGPEVELLLDPGEGWVRGWFWDPADHEARLRRCGVQYDPQAEYTIVGYGLTHAQEGQYSDLFPLTDPILIDLRGSTD